MAHLGNVCIEIDRWSTNGTCDITSHFKTAITTK